MARPVLLRGVSCSLLETHFLLQLVVDAEPRRLVLLVLSSDLWLLEFFPIGFLIVPVPRATRFPDANRERRLRFHRSFWACSSSCLISSSRRFHLFGCTSKSWPCSARHCLGPWLCRSKRCLNEPSPLSQRAEGLRGTIFSTSPR